MMRKTIRELKARLKQIAPETRLIMEPIPQLTVDEWEALSQRHHEGLLYGGVKVEH